MIGLELEDARATAVRLTDEGTVAARATLDASGDLASAAARAIDEVGSTNSRVIGVAAASPDNASVAAAVAALAPRLGGAQHRVVMSGTAAAVAETWTGAARGIKDIAYFAVAEHTSAGIVRDGAPLTGRRGRAASVAWLALNPVEREDYRRTGCLEAEVAAAGIVRRLIWRIKAGDRSRIQERVSDDLAAITIDHILDAARSGDGVSISVVRDTAKYLGMAAANLVVIADPEMLVLGGIMASAADLLLEPVRTELARRLPKPMMDALVIAPATLGSDAAAIGAARLAASAVR
ncbi:MAG TPA: ROK family protein [Vicinamibacterales bacterium]|nr:ROK family protein [Vicinamibacterales bacterium]